MIVAEEHEAININAEKYMTTSLTNGSVFLHLTVVVFQVSLEIPRKFKLIAYSKLIQTSRSSEVINLGVNRKRLQYLVTYRFYRAMHFSAKRGIAIACRLSVCLSVCNVGEL